MWALRARATYGIWSFCLGNFAFFTLRSVNVNLNTFRGPECNITKMGVYALVVLFHLALSSNTYQVSDISQSQIDDINTPISSADSSLQDGELEGNRPYRILQAATYTYHSDAKTHTEALGACAAGSGWLASIGSASENKKV